ncbi:hypothetical protein Pfo_023559 [Paulownia fortunei]|nr:hypothetical protein Pfo_023559 [Paulownia fortunei]
MALSYYSNWGTFQHEYNSDMSVLAQAEIQLPPELFNDNFGFLDACCDIDYLFEPNDIFYSENCNPLHPYLSTPPDNNLNSTLTPETFQVLQEYEPFHCLKRQKVYDYEQLYSELKHGLTNGLQDYPPEVVIPTLPDFPTAPPVYSGGSCETVTKPPNGGSLSAQSIAARQRRRKITEKTQELGMLIPGGQKMNTAEMFQAAYKYIKYLQGQVGILEFMGSYHQNGDSFQSEELHGLLESPLILEKLYSTEKCLVPHKLVQH